jgi:hypothetical protein
MRRRFWQLLLGGFAVSVATVTIAASAGAVSGSLVWQTWLGDDIDSSPTVVDGVLYVGSDDSNVYAMDAVTGEVLWNTLTGGAVDSSPAVADGLVYVGSDDDRLWALDGRRDADGDGVPDDIDICAGTVLPEDAPAAQKKNRYAATAAGEFEGASGRPAGITVADTGGCSGTQIIEAAGLGPGHTKFGITKSALRSWIESLVA